MGTEKKIEQVNKQKTRKQRIQRALRATLIATAVFGAVLFFWMRGTTGVKIIKLIIMSVIYFLVFYFFMVKKKG